MFLTKLTLDTRSAAARRDLASAYEMHRTLSRAFAECDDKPPSRFLWRLENTDAALGQAVLLVQSQEEGRWDRLPCNEYTFDVASKNLAWNQLLVAGARYRFRLLANPTVTRDGKRYGLTIEAEQLGWLERQLQNAGCSVQGVIRSRSERWTIRKKGHLITVQAVGFDGVLVAGDVSLLEQTIANGVGHAKSLGLGLLSIARLRE